MFDINVLGVLRVVKAFLPALISSGRGDIVVMSSTAGHQAYEGGGGYVAAKHGTHSIAATLRLELAGEPVRVIEIAPGMVATDEFTLKRVGETPNAQARSTKGSRTRSRPKTSPTPWCGRSPDRTTSTSTSWSSAPSPRRPSTRSPVTRGSEKGEHTDHNAVSARRGAVRTARRAPHGTRRVVRGRGQGIESGLR